MNLIVRFLSGASRGEQRIVHIDRGRRIGIGRAIANEIRLTNEPVVSSFHASIVEEAGMLFLIDNGSTNGTTLRGARIQRAALRSGDRVVLGKNGPELEFVIADDRAAPRRPEPAAAGAAPAAAPAPAIVVRAPFAGGPPSAAAPPVAGFAPPPAPAAAPAPAPIAIPRVSPPPPPAPARFCSLCGRRLLPDMTLCPFCNPPTARQHPPPAPAAPPSRDEQALAALAAEGFIVHERLPPDRDALRFRAERADLGQEVVAKVLLRERSAAETATEKRFLREARLAARLRHPNVTALYDVRAREGYVVLVLESLRGHTLADEIRAAGRLAPARALSVAACVARALVYIHGLGIVHRDIKPEAVIVTEENEVKLADLGLAKTTAGDPRLPKVTVMGDIVGSLGHMAPEQVIDARQADPRSDIYALGALIFHAVAGRPPHTVEERLDLPARHDLPPPPRLDEAAPGTPPALVALVAEAMDPWPERRFASAAEMLSAIEHLERALAGPAGPAPGRPSALLPAFDRGAPPGAEAAGDGFQGRFKETEIVELLQMVELHKKAGTLEIASAAASGTLEFSDGRLASATCGATRGVDAAYALLAARTGSFRLRFHFVPIDVGAPTLSSVLFEHLRRADEAGGGDAAAGPGPDATLLLGRG